MFVRVAEPKGAVRVAPPQMRAIAADARRRSTVIATIVCISAVVFAGIWIQFADVLVINRAPVRDSNGVLIDTFEEPNGAMLGGLAFAFALAGVGLWYARNAIRAGRCAALADDTFEWRLAGYGIFGLERDETSPSHLTFTISRWERARLLRVPTARIKR